MSNVTSLMTSPFSNQTSMPSLDELLDQLGFGLWETVVNTFILPPINLIGIALCSFSLWIFSRPSFEDPIFFYYKLLCLVNIILLLHNIPSCIFISPFYFHKHFSAQIISLALFLVCLLIEIDVGFELEINSVADYF